MKKRAFTLAEVLITLGIVGIVAALTLPALTGKYQQKILETQFKKSYSNLQTAINKVNSENGIPYECYTLKNGNGYQYSQCKEFWQNFFKQYKSARICKNNDYSCRPRYKSKAEVTAAGGTTNNINCSFPINEHTGFNLNDGSIIYIYGDIYNPDYTPFHNVLFFGFDINGKKGPNKWGYDLFYLNLYKRNEKAPVLGLTAICELIEKGGQSAEEIMIK